jgi:GrpB-like predicted nucleotidyltransferase (UPF0157 family)/RimJ/RimL family protein N-acetyltransferase
MLLATQRLRLRELTSADLDGFLALHSDPEVVRFVGTLDRAQAQERLQANEREWTERGHGLLAVIARDGGRLLGRVGLRYWPQFQETEAGWLLRRDAWGHGYATEAAGACVNWGFAALPIPYITAMIHPDNTRSTQLAGRLGFKPAREDVLLGSPVIVHALERHDWTGEMPPCDSRTAAAEDLARAGGRDARVEIVDYDPAWPTAFEAERNRLAPLLQGAEIHHFGSTAVPGLAAKPVIDMIALVPDLDAPIPGLVADARYQFPRAFNATLTHRRFLCYPTAAHRTHHLHLVDEREELERRLRFRDRLRADPALAMEYAALKRTLAARHRHDREAYTNAKSGFIHDHDQPSPPSAT